MHSAFKIQTHKMFLDTNFNSISSVLQNIYQNFAESAMKYYRYVKSMQVGNQPRAALLIGMLVDLGVVHMTSEADPDPSRNARKHDGDGIHVGES